MRKFYICICLSLIILFCIRSAYSEPITFSVTIDPENFEACSEPFCQLLSKICSDYSKDFEALANNPEASNINIKIYHECSWLSWLKNKTLPKLSKQESIATNEIISEPLQAPEKYPWLKKFKFLDEDALVKIDSVNKIRDVDFFIEGDLTYCRVFPNGSPANYGFINREKIREALRGLYGGELSITGKRSFSFKSSREEASFIADSALLSFESVKFVSADKQKLEDVRQDYGQTRYFFRTDSEGVYFVAVEGDKERFYLAAGDYVVSRERLREILSNEQRINYDPESEIMTFNLWTPDNELTDQNINACIEIFISQLIQNCEQIDTARW